MKIPIHYYTEITDATRLSDECAMDCATCYIHNEGGKVYLVEVWA